jgi:hypothetical protein
MRITSYILLGAVASLAVLPHAAGAQQRRGSTPSLPTGTLFEVTPYAGYLIAGDMISGPLGTAVGPAPAPLVGAQLGMKLAPGFSLIGNLATGSSDVKAGIPILGGVSVAQSRVVLYDAGLQLDLPMATTSGTSFSPFLQAGVGGMRYEITQSFLTTTSQNLAGNVGVGADIALGSGVGLRVMAKDYIGRFDFQEATSFDVNTNTTQNYAFTLGVRFSF